MNDPEKKIRLFAALSVPADIKKQLMSLPHTGLDARWSAGEDLHITLRFLGDVPEQQLTSIQETLARVKRPGFSVEIGGMGFFDIKKQAVLWAAVQSTRKMTALAGDINELLAPLGFEMPNKPFTPHITLARLKNSQSLPAYIKQHGSKIKARWEAQEFKLFLSGQPDEKNNKYKELYNFPLRD